MQKAIRVTYLFTEVHVDNIEEQNSTVPVTVVAVVVGVIVFLLAIGGTILLFRRRLVNFR